MLIVLHTNVSCLLCFAGENVVRVQCYTCVATSMSGMCVCLGLSCLRYILLHLYRVVLVVVVSVVMLVLECNKALLYKVISLCL